jgi:rubredoxin
MANTQIGPTEYRCDDCEYLYRAAEFDGLDLSEQPDDFICPECQASKSHFQVYVPPPDDLESEPSNGDESDVNGSGGSKSIQLAGLTVRKVYTEAGDQSVSTLKELYDESELDTQPTFQRYVVWTATQQSKLVESVLLGLPIPRIYLAENEDETQVVVDGQQRLTALFRFMSGHYPLQNLKVLEAMNGRKYRDLEKKLRKRVKNFKLSTVLIQKESDEDLRFDLYERLNTGSVGLNDQELRNSVYRGEYNNFIYRLAENGDWRKLLNLKDAHKRMADAELVLRFMAFRDQTYMNFPDKSVKDFLNHQMILGTSYDDRKLKKAERDFKQAVQLTRSVFGERAFRKFTAGDEDDPSGDWERRRVLAVADLQLWGFTQFKKNEVVPKADSIWNAAIELMADPTFTDLVTSNTSSTPRVKRRFEMWKGMLDSVIGPSRKEARAFDRKTKEALFHQDPACAICGQEIRLIDDAQVDHVKPFSKGGRTKKANAALTHRFCNESKGARAKKRKPKAARKRRPVNR